MKSKKRNNRTTALIKRHEYQCLSRKGRRCLEEICTCATKTFSRKSTINH